MAKQQQLQLAQEFVECLRAAAGENLVSVILYGSAAEGEFHPNYSRLDLLCILRDTSYPSLQKLMDLVDWWKAKKHRPPLLLTADELKTSADVFSIEFFDMKQRYRVLYGEDVLQNLDIPMEQHRFQIEYEIREKLVLLRQHLLIAGNNEKQLWEVMLFSLSSFTTLFRHILVELGQPGRKHSREAVTELAARLNFSPGAFVELMAIRAGERDRKQLQAVSVATEYLRTIEQVVAAVDTIESSSETRRDR